MIRFEPGTVIPKEYLQEFNLELALQGHPLATKWSESVRLFRYVAEGRIAFDYWHLRSARWQHMNEEAVSDCADRLRLAPLCVKDGHPLHVGDEIECMHPNWSRPMRVRVHLEKWKQIEADELFEWRWPESKESPADPEQKE